MDETLQAPFLVVVAMHDRFPVFEVVLKKRGRRWRWLVCTTKANAVMCGSEGSRAGARYQADRALFLLLLTAPLRVPAQAARQARASDARR
jgi:hypothetical protein